MNKFKKGSKIFRPKMRPEMVSIFLILIFLAAALYSVFVSPQLYQWSMREGDIALKNVYAPYDFTYYWEIDEGKTAQAKQTVLDNVPYFFKRDITIEESANLGIINFFAVIKQVKERELAISEKLVSLKEKIGNDNFEEIAEKNLRFFLEYPDTRELEGKAIEITKRIFEAGCIADKDMTSLRALCAVNICILNEANGKEKSGAINDILKMEDVQAAADDYISKEFKNDRKMQKPLSSVISVYLLPNLRLDDKKTKEARDLAAKKSEPIYKKWTVEKNELIIEKGKRVNACHVAQMMQIPRFFRQGTTPTFFFGVLLLFMLLGLVAVIYISVMWKPDFLKDTKNIALILFNIFFMLVMSDFVMRSPQPSYFIPMASMAMLITLLAGPCIAFLSVVLMGILISFLVGGGIEVMMVLLVGSSVGIFFVKDTRRRARILWTGLLVGIAKFMAVVCVGLINGMDLDFYVKDGIWGMASGVVSGFIVMGLLPVFEHIFKISTNISLLELSDLNHPLLKKLSIEAPGTYHHSIMVGNLAESACDAIGANSLQARVGAYYHDIGKISKAEYFSENEMGGPSRHANLAPSMSALIISKHVKDGSDLAKKYKLNSTITDFITQHHGDSLIAYFYQKALEKTEEGVRLNEEDFRYPGPRPQTKECAIVLLADSCEASSRALDDPTPASIRNLVKKIINNKFVDGQLDECDLTLKDMNKIAESFVRVLMGTFHTRLGYPEAAKKKINILETDANRDKSQKSKRKKKD